jgi:hypothetical protein
MMEKVSHFAAAQLTGMPKPVEANVTAGPINEKRYRCRWVTETEGRGPEAVEKSWGLLGSGTQWFGARH